MAISTIYLDGGVLKSAGNAFNSQNPRNIMLENFFQKAVISLLQDKLAHSEFSMKFSPYRHNYLITKSSAIDSFLKGGYFGLMVRKILGLDKYKLSYEIRKFAPGCYTLLHDKEKEKPGIDFIIDFSKPGDYVGGYVTYLNESEELLILRPKLNTLTFVERGKGMMKYTKYFTHRNKNPLIQVAGTLY